MSSGIIRRIDDLGRIVIPREVRRMLGIREGDPLEISVSDNGKSVVINRYNTMEELLGTQTCRSVLSVLCRHHENCRFWILDRCGVPALRGEQPTSANEEVLDRGTRHYRYGIIPAVAYPDEEKSVVGGSKGQCCRQFAEISHHEQGRLQ